MAKHFMILLRSCDDGEHTYRITMYWNTKNIFKRQLMDCLCIDRLGMYQKYTINIDGNNVPGFFYAPVELSRLEVFDYIIFCESTGDKICKSCYTKQVSQNAY